VSNRRSRPHRDAAYAEFDHARRVMLVVFFQCVSAGHLSAAEAADEVLATFSAMRQLPHFKGLV
jgi:hypothetical protein